MPPDRLPHAYPFRFVDAIVDPPGPVTASHPWQGTVRTRLSCNGWAASTGCWDTPMLFAEAIAQAALLLEGGDPEVGRRGFLAGIDQFAAARPPQAGESLAISVRLATRFGAIVKFDGEVRSGDEVLARGSVLVKKGEDVGGHS